MRRRDPDQVASDYLEAAGLWEVGYNIIDRQAKHGREYTAADAKAIIEVHRTAFADHAAENLSAEDAETWRDRESDLAVEDVARLRGVSVPTIIRRRRRLLPKVEALWRSWPYSTWKRAPDDVPFIYARAHRHDRDH